jgi:hypothetical protein
MPKPQPANQISEARLAANQANAQLSTGPTSVTGKAASSLNGLKTGLTGRTVLLPGDDAAAYQGLIESFVKRHQPVGDAEQNLVQSLADTEWRLLRIPALEMGIYALARFEFAELFPDESETVRRALIEAKTFLVYQRPLNNLSVQEGRLRRQREKDTETLRKTQDYRKDQAVRLLNAAAYAYIEAVNEDRNDVFNPAELGFEFSMEQIEMRALDLCPHLFDAWARQQEEEAELSEAA